MFQQGVGQTHPESGGVAEADTNNAHFVLKVGVLGDIGVGKTSLLQDEPAKNEQALQSTPCVDFKSKFYEMGSYTYQVQFWECPGSERYMPMASRFCAGAAAAIFIFDLTDRSTFDHIEEWVREVGKIDVQIKLLVGNKAEDPSQREVSKDEAQSFAMENEMQYTESSALMQGGCEHVFKALLSIVNDTIPSPPEPSLLLKKGVRIGNRLLEDQQFRQSLYASSRQGGAGGNGPYSDGLANPGHFRNWM